MAITNGYCTLAEYKAYADITSTESTDDTVIEQLVEKASRFIDNFTRRTYYARTETHLYDAPDDRELWIMDDDLLSVTTLTNGNGVVISSSDFILYPANKSPKYKIVLKGSSSIWWQPDSNGNIEQVISLLGSYGFSSSTPADIKGACLEIVKSEYGKRNGENGASSAVITAAGVVITPKGIPDGALQILNAYRRLV